MPGRGRSRGLRIGLVLESISMIPEQLRLALYAQILYAALAIAWQLIGVAQVAMGRPALGPTASLALAGQAVVAAVLYVIALRRSPLLFLLLTVASAFAASVSIGHTLTADPALWPSDGNRYLSIVVNLVGIVGLCLAVIGYARWRRDRDIAENSNPDTD